MEEDSDGCGGGVGSFETCGIEGGIDDWDTLGSVEVRVGGGDDEATLGGSTGVVDGEATL